MANSLQNERPFRILIAISGSIAAYKIADLVSQFKKSAVPNGERSMRDIEVRCLLTESATQFVSPLVLETLSGNPAQSRLFGDSVSGTEHIRLARWPDLVIFAPASANLLARLSLGLADDLVTTVALACEPTIPWLIAPAMNTVMWNQTITQEHVARLRSRGAEFVEPASGVLACGEEGEGKLAAIEAIFNEALLILQGHSHKEFAPSNPPSGKPRPTVLITAGPTTTRIDSVRYITNPSTGKMGAAMAEEFLMRGYNVIYVLGMDKGVVKPRPVGAGKLEILPVTTAEEMLEASLKHLSRAQGVIATAAVMDYRVKATHEGKLKRAASDTAVELTPSVDVLSTLREHAEKSGQWFFGFAAETDDIEANGKKKLSQKKLDFLFVNPVERNGYREDSTVGFASNTNEGVLLFNDGRKIKMPSASKPSLAHAIYQAVEKDIAGFSESSEKKGSKDSQLNGPLDCNNDCDEHEYP